MATQCQAWRKLAGCGVRAITSASAENASQLAQFGADEIATLELAQTGAGVGAQLAGLAGDAQGVVVAGTAMGKIIAPTLAALTSGALSTNTTGTPTSTSPVTVERGAFSSKGIETISLNNGLPIISFVPNAIGIKEEAGAGAMTSANAAGADKLTTNEMSVASGKVERCRAQCPPCVGSRWMRSRPVSRSFSLSRLPGGKHRRYSCSHDAGGLCRGARLRTPCVELDGA